MTSWWDSLTWTSQVYWSIAIFASLLQLFMLAGSLVGGDFGDHGDAGADADAANSGSGVKLISARVLVAFMVGFGWAGVLAQRQGMGTLPAALSALVTGVVFMGVLFGVLRFLVSMKHDGTLNYRNAIGQKGQVYVTIPPSRAAGGQVELLLQGRLITTAAVTDAFMPLPPHTPVEVKDVGEANILIVEALSQAPA